MQLAEVLQDESGILDFLDYSYGVESAAIIPGVRLHMPARMVLNAVKSARSKALEDGPVKMLPALRGHVMEIAECEHHIQVANAKVEFFQISQCHTFWQVQHVNLIKPRLRKYLLLNGVGTNRNIEFSITA